MYALTFMQESRGGVWPGRPVDWSLSAPVTSSLLLEEDAFDEDSSLSAVRDLALTLGLTEDDAPLLSERD
jgi:hypothetical protein